MVSVESGCRHALSYRNYTGELCFMWCLVTTLEIDFLALTCPVYIVCLYCARCGAFLFRRSVRGREEIICSADLSAHTHPADSVTGEGKMMHPAGGAKGTAMGSMCYPSLSQGKTSDYPDSAVQTWS
ncbi:hypothetical protein AOLI_G00085590 [Acnodon oligacanthus]